jgi:cobalt transporter subunit CbtB
MRDETQTAVGGTARSATMTTQTIRTASTASVVMPALFAALVGALIVFSTGHAQSAALHDAAHDVRHATGFPCH